MTLDWDRWRAEYDELSYEEQVEFYGRAFELYPVQRSFDVDAAGEFLDAMKPMLVLEIGGWDGALAAVCLDRDPKITVWRNLEICRAVVEAHPGTDARYEPVVPDQFVWDQPDLGGWDVLVMSHVAEHMRWHELQRVLSLASGADGIYLAMPIPENGPCNWSGYDGTHILEVGWAEITEFLAGLGFVAMGEPRTREVRCWRRR